MQSNKIFWAIIGLALIVTVLITVDQCKKPSNVQVIAKKELAIQKKEQSVIINDSTKGVKQDVLITYDKEVIKQLQDSILRMINKETNLKAELLLSYRSTYKEIASVGKLRDSISRKIEELLAKVKDSSLSAELFADYKKKILNTKIPYSISNKYRYEVGSVDFYGNINSDTLLIKSEPLISFGKTNKWYQSPKYSVVVADKNPLITNSGLSSIKYEPKEKVQFSIGPIIMANEKGNFSAGVGTNFKKGILSLSLGYQLIQNKK